MEHIAALLLIVGCSDDLSHCRELPAPVPIFESAEECEAELPVAMRRFMNEYPQLMANCVVVDPAMAEEEAQLVWDVNSQGNLVAAVEFDSDVMVARDATDNAANNGFIARQE